MTTDQNNRWRRVHKQAIRTATPVFVPVSHENSLCSPLRTTSEPCNGQLMLLISPHAKYASLESHLKGYFAPISYIDTYNKAPNSLPDAASRRTSTDGHFGQAHGAFCRDSQVLQTKQTSPPCPGVQESGTAQGRDSPLMQTGAASLASTELVASAATIHTDFTSLMNQLLQQTWLIRPFCRDNAQLTPSEESAWITGS